MGFHLQDKDIKKNIGKYMSSITNISLDLIEICYDIISYLINVKISYLWWIFYGVFC